MGVREYVEEVTLNINEITKWKKLENAVLREGFDAESHTGLKMAIEVIGASASLLGLAFVTFTPVGIATGIIGILSVLAPTDKNDLEVRVNRGYRKIDELLMWMEDNNYDAVKVKVAFEEYYDYTQYTIRFVTDTDLDLVTAVHTGSGWMVPPQE